MDKNIIEIANLTKYYGKARGIEDVSFSVKEGEIFGFIGPNGAGKTTTIRLLVGLIFPSSGSASIFGKDCLASGPEIRREVGYLPGEVFFYDRMKVSQMLSYASSFYDKDCTKRISDLCARLEVDTSRRLDSLSYGNRKKVGIVLGLLHSPRLIILDEPTSGLDPLMQQTFFEIIREEQARGVTVLFSSHILGEVQRLCDRIAFIKEGGIIRIDDIASINRESYRKYSVICDTLKGQDLRIDGVEELIADGNELSFLHSGDINEVLNVLNGHRIIDLKITEPSLEEIFMNYYR